MLKILTQFSVYFYIGGMLIFIYTIFKFNKAEQTSEYYQRLNLLQRCVIMLLHFVGFFLLFVRSRSEALIYLYGQQVVFFMAFFFLYNKLYKHASQTLINHIFFLLMMSYVILTRLSFETGVKQFHLSLLSALATFIVPYAIKYIPLIRKLKWTYAIIGFVLQLAVLFFGIEVYGSRNWLQIGTVTFQPSELVKIIYIFFIASIFKKKQSFNQVVLSSIITLAFVIIFILQNDLGTALIFFIMFMMMLYVATSQWLYFIGGLASASLAAIIAYEFFYHVQVRVEAWINPWADISDKGYQIAQSLFAIGTGSWFGLGLGNGMPEKIPVVQTDFIFSAIAEEWGSLFAIGLIGIMLSIVLIGFRISKLANQFFYALVGVGISSVYAFQVFLIIGGVTKLIPLTGVTLPFVSYGGTSLLASFLMFAILQGIYVLNQEVEEPKVV